MTAHSLILQIDVWSQVRKKYISFVNDGLTIESSWQQLQNQVLLDSSQLMTRMRELLEDKKEIGEIPRAQRYPGRPALHDFFHDVTNKEERDRKMLVAHLEYGYTLKQIAEASGVHYTTVSRAIKRAQ